MKKNHAAIVGYGNTGKCVLEAIQASPDFEPAGIVRRSTSAGNVHPELKGIKTVDNIARLEGVDVAFLCTPTRNVAEYAKTILSMGIHTVDCYDIHSSIWELREELNTVAQKSGSVAVVSAGWDPGSDSTVRALLEAIAPKGITCTNFGPGMSMGHTVAAKAVSGVHKALSMTIPTGNGVHRRMVYIEIKEGYGFDDVAKAIKADAYFCHDETHVVQVADVDSLQDIGHGVNLTRKGVSGATHNQLFEFNMKINNPALTAQVMVACARAAIKAKPGAYTMIEIPVIDMLYGNREELIRRLV